MRQGIFKYKDGTKKEDIKFFSKYTHQDTGGTYLQGDIVTTYENLVKVLGEPVQVNDIKTQCEWIITFLPEKSESQVATIYDWKLGKQYLGEEGTDKENIKYWHIGGYNKIVVDYLTILFNQLNKN